MPCQLVDLSYEISVALVLEALDTTVKLRWLNATIGCMATSCCDFKVLSSCLKLVQVRQPRSQHQVLRNSSRAYKSAEHIAIYEIHYRGLNDHSINQGAP